MLENDFGSDIEKMKERKHEEGFEPLNMRLGFSYFKGIEGG